MSTWRKRGRGRLRAVALVVAGTLLASSASAGSARVDIIDSEIEDGVYTGSIHIYGGFKFPLEGFGFALFTANLDGAAELVAEGESISGEWTYDGTGFGGSSGLPVDFSADSVYVGSGTFTGTPTAARVVGDNQFTSTATFLGVTQTSSGSQVIDEALVDVMAGCGQVVGTFSQRINASIEAGIAGADSFINGVVALYSEPPTAEAVELAMRAAAFRASEDDPHAKVIAAATFLAEVEELQAELSRRSSCPATKAYFNLLTNVAADLLSDSLADIESVRADDAEAAALLVSQYLPGLVRLGVSTGATGAGAVGGRGAELMVGARTAAQEAVDVLVSSSENIGEIVSLARLSAQMGWDLRFGEVSDGDVLLTFGVSGAEASGGEGE